MGRQRETFWFALKVFYNKAELIQSDFRKARYETYLPKMIVEKFEKGELKYIEKPIIASLLFVRCTERFLLEYKRANDELFLYYSNPDNKRPGRINDSEMDNFKRVTSVNDPDILYLGSDSSKLCIGDRVRVTDGIYKGSEGYVRRIRHARKVIVCITGVAVVALSNIHPQYLEKI